MQKRYRGEVGLIHPSHREGRPELVPLALGSGISGHCGDVVGPAFRGFSIRPTAYDFCTLARHERLTFNTEHGRMLANSSTTASFLLDMTYSIRLFARILVIPFSLVYARPVVYALYKKGDDLRT